MRSRLDRKTGSAESDVQLGVVGLWHLGCTTTAAWLQLGLSVIAIDPQGTVSRGLNLGHAPVSEPGLTDTLQKGLRSGTLMFSGDAARLADCSIVFIANDTVIRADDSSDLSEVWESLEVVAKNTGPGTTVVVSSQLPVGTARALRERLSELNASAELVYVPENLRLGEAIDCYLRPGYIVIGSASPTAAQAAERLFARIPARRILMSLESAELTKHAINSFLATSISLANHWADIATSISADYHDVETALRADARVGERAYLSPGLGFSGGTLGRDLATLAKISQEGLHGGAPLFDAVLKYNSDRAAQLVAELIESLEGVASRVAVLGLTYKPGTSTLRRSGPIEIARALASAGISVVAHDPGASRTEVAQLGVDIVDDAYSAVQSADVALLLTAWPEYRNLDFNRLGRAMRHRRLLDPAGFLRVRAADLSTEGFTVGWSTKVPQEWRR